MLYVYTHLLAMYTLYEYKDLHALYINCNKLMTIIPWIIAEM